MNFLKLTLLSGSFKKVLQYLVEKNNDPVADYLLKADSFVENFQKELLSTEVVKATITDYARHLTLRTDEFLVAFLPKGNEPKFSHSGNWLQEGRQTGKPGKIIQKVIGPDKFTNAQYEQFVYHLKGYWESGGCEFKLVSGEDIRYWYNCEHYYSCNNTLGNSCMKGGECSSYFDLYVEQPECQMLVALKDGLLKARALVWTIDGKTFLDRAYYCEDSLLTCMTNYAKEHGWYIRSSNHLLSDGDSQYFLGPEDNYAESQFISFTLRLKRFYSDWPYVDTFRYLHADSNIMTTFVPTEDYYNCSHTDGTYYMPENEMYCENCGNRIYEGDSIYSDWYDCYGCEECMSWSEILESYILDSRSTTLYLADGRYDYVPNDWENDNENYVEVDGYYYEIGHPNLILNKDGTYPVQ